ncbi:pentatricopeptide repeat-containing protein, mitochondrial [Fagus crenata]
MALALSSLKPLWSSSSTSASSSTQDSLSSSSSFSYRPAVILPGLGNNSSDYLKLEATLKENYGIPTVVAKVSRIDWLRNAAGLVDPNYWRGTLRPRPVLDWYLKRIDEAVQEAKELAQGGTLSLIGHSAGGWLARVYLEEFGLSHISLLLTLGTPHLPPPKGLSGVIDQTRGLLYYVEENCSKAVYTPHLKYVCIAGRYIQGAQLFSNSSVKVESAVPIDSAQSISEGAIMNDLSTSTSNATTLRARFVGQGYKQVCGQADVWGDGVVPEVSAHLEGALNISLDGVYHSPVGSDDELRPWYGSPAVVEKWIQHLLN